MTPALRGDDPLIGQAVDRYTITTLIGAGGTGRVYRAVQPSIGARVAIKVLSREAAEDREAVARFFAEARAVNSSATRASSRSSTSPSCPTAGRTS